jgi:serine/threonine protein kinase
VVGFSVDPLIQRTLMTQMLSALAYLQQRKLVHSDIKPDNILQNGMGKEFYLADFGLSSYLDNARSGRGTHEYAPPEAFGNSMVDTTADIWSLGITLLEMEHVSEMKCCLSKAGKDVRKYHRGIISIAQSRRHDLLPMLKENAEERFDAAKCVQHYFPRERTSLQRSETPSKDRKMMPSNSKVAAKLGDPMSLDPFPSQRFKNPSKDIRMTPFSSKFSAKSGDPMSLDPSFREQRQPAPAKRPGASPNTIDRSPQQREHLQHLLQLKNQSRKNPDAQEKLHERPRPRNQKNPWQGQTNEDKTLRSSRS